MGIFDRGLQGTMLSSGEQFDGNALVAGHAHLPIGTFAWILNPVTHKSVQVRIVHRMSTAPYVLYLSEAAARAVQPLQAQMYVYLSPPPASQVPPPTTTMQTPPTTNQLLTASYQSATPLPTYAPPTSNVATPNRRFAKGLTTFQTHEWGETTSTGLPYSPTGLYAAHRFLPIGTRVKVVNTRNGKSVVVSINDRGPIAFPERILDLNYQAGVELGMERDGKVEAELYVLDAIPSYYYMLPPNFEAWTVMLSSSIHERWARDLARRLGHDAYVVQARVNGQITYRVFYGHYGARTAAIAAQTSLIRRGYRTAMVKFLLDEHHNLVDFSPYGGPSPH